ncbi:MAG: DUF4145 domain-containing protein [Deltaproteobacteria bacterium]|nr:DUF4145 domain-containing protein [Deltaproteobacteria bacterium]
MCRKGCIRQIGVRGFLFKRQIDLENEKDGGQCPPYRTENNLYELITQARDADILTDEAIQLAHLIRRHRNITAHEQVDIRTKEARVLLVLLSAALLWPLLPE